MEHNQRSIIASILLNIVGTLCFLLSPLIVGSLVEGNYNLSISQSGYFISALMLGITLSSIVFFFIGLRLNQRHIRTLGIGVGFFSFLLIGFFKNYTALIGLVALAGFGGGFLATANFTLLSRASNAGKNFSILLFSMTSIGIICTLGLLQIENLFGTEFIFFTLAIIFLLSLPLVLFIDPVLASEKSQQHISSTETYKYGKFTPWICLLMCFFTYVGVGAFWTYAERIGVSTGLTSELVALILSSGLILTLLGCVAAFYIGEWVDYTKPLILALATLVLIFILLGGTLQPFTYISYVLVFYFLWNMIDIFELATLSSMTQSGRYAALVPAFQAAGNMVGPAIGASLLSHGWGLKSVMYFASLSVSLVLIMSLYCNWLRRKNRDLNGTLRGPAGDR